MEIDQLRKAGLGKRKIAFPNKDADHNGLVKHLEASYPKLKSGHSFELLKSIGGGSGTRNQACHLARMDIQYATSERHYVLVKQSYIRPLQVKLDMTPGEVNYVCY